MNRNAVDKRRAFSLLELILVMAIMATFAAIAAPRYGLALARHRADLAARRVSADLCQAQSYAKTTSVACTVTFFAATETYQLLNVPSLDGRPGDYTVALSAHPYQANIVSADFDGGSQVVFDGWGSPDHGGTIVVAVGAEQRTITVDGDTGQVSIQ